MAEENNNTNYEAFHNQMTSEHLTVDFRNLHLNITNTASVSKTQLKIEQFEIFEFGLNQPTAEKR